MIDEKEVLDCIKADIGIMERTQNHARKILLNPSCFSKLEFALAGSLETACKMALRNGKAMEAFVDIIIEAKQEVEGEAIPEQETV